MRAPVSSTGSVIIACAAIGIRPIVCRQERVGVGIADGYSRVKKGRVNGVFAAQHGPGIENAYAGVAQAFAGLASLGAILVSAAIFAAMLFITPSALFPIAAVISGSTS